MKSLQRLYDELTRIVMSNPGAKTRMDALMYEMFRKRRIDLLSTDQVERLLAKMKHIFKVE